jgi:hypothetical protein
MTNEINEIPKRDFKQMTCECGGRYTSQNKTSHIRTEKHKAFINKLPYERPCKNFQLRKEFLDEETLARKRLYINQKMTERKIRLKERELLLPEIPM